MWSYRRMMERRRKAIAVCVTPMILWQTEQPLIKNALFSGPIVLFDKVLIPQVRALCCTQRIHQGKRSKSELLVDSFPSSSPLPTVHRPEHRDPFKPHLFVERLGPQASFSSLSNTLCQAENAPPKKKPRCLPNDDLTPHSVTQHNTHTQHTPTQTPTQAPHTHFRFL